MKILKRQFASLLNTSWKVARNNLSSSNVEIVNEYSEETICIITEY